MSYSCPYLQPKFPPPMVDHDFSSLCYETVRQGLHLDLNSQVNETNAAKVYMCLVNHIVYVH